MPEGNASVSVVMDRLRSGYEPHSGSPKEQAAYLSALGEFSEPVLEAVADRVTREWTFRTWPVPGLLRKWAIEIQREKEPHRPPEHRRFKPNLVPREERERVARFAGRMRKLMASGEYSGMSHEEAYDAVYRDEMGEAHKREMLDRLSGRVPGYD